jgi:hypothetical protein
VVGRIAAVLGMPDGWLVVLCMGRINCRTPCIVGVALGDVGASILGMGDAVVQEQIVTFA